MHPEDGRIRLVNRDDGERRRVTVFFRLLMAIPQFVWWMVWSLGAFLALPVHWVAAIIKGGPLDGLHGFYRAYVRFTTHLYAYFYLAAERWPPFLGDADYAIDVDIPGPRRQPRWTIALRLFLALPPLLLAAALSGSSGGGTGSSTGDPSADAAATVGFSIGLVYALAFLAWFASLALGRTPRGLRDAIAYTIGYSAQAWGYLFLLTERYPTSDPSGIPREPMPEHPVTLAGALDDRRRNRLMVLFRLPLAFPHLVWLTLWGVVTLVVALVGWLVTLVLGRLPAPLHGFFARFVRYSTHVTAFLYVLGGPFPGFTGRPGGYPVDLEIAGPGPQSRVKTLFRFFLAFPAFIIVSSLGTVQLFAGVGAWFAALFTGTVPQGLHRLLAWTVRYQGQVSAYVLLLTDRYPYSGPDGPGVQPEPEPAPAWMGAPEAPERPAAPQASPTAESP